MQVLEQLRIWERKMRKCSDLVECTQATAGDKSLFSPLLSAIVMASEAIKVPWRCLEGLIHRRTTEVFQAKQFSELRDALFMSDNTALSVVSESEGKVNLDIIPFTERKTLQEKIFAKFVGTTFKNMGNQRIEPCNFENPVICFVRAFSDWESGSPELKRHIELFMMVAKFLTAMAATAEQEIPEEHRLAASEFDHQKLTGALDALTSEKESPFQRGLTLFHSGLDWVKQVEDAVARLKRDTGYVAVLNRCYEKAEKLKDLEPQSITTNYVGEVLFEDMQVRKEICADYQSMITATSTRFQQAHN